MFSRAFLRVAILASALGVGLLFGAGLVAAFAAEAPQATAPTGQLQVEQYPPRLEVTITGPQYGRTCEQAGKRRRNESMFTVSYPDYGMTTLCAQDLVPAGEPRR